MSIKERILSSCTKCNEEGFLRDTDGVDCIPCTCLLKFRAYNRLAHGGFSVSTLDYVTDNNYNIPNIDSGSEYLDYFFKNPFEVEKEGLGLYIYSKERGRGKTTLTHKLMFELVKIFFDKTFYVSEREYAFENVEEFIASFKYGIDDEDLKWKKTWYVLDDLGNEDGSAKWKKQSTVSSLQRMLHYRRDHKLPIIITSNHEPGDLSKLYNKDLDSLLEIKGDGTLGGMLYRAVNVGGAEDLRFSEENSKWNI